MTSQENRFNDFGGTEITKSSLFSIKNYDKRENQLTHALLHIFKVGGTDFLANFSKEFDLDIPDPIEIRSQAVPESSFKKGITIPDGLITTKPFRLFIECKIVPDSVNEKQLAGHHNLVKHTNDETLTYLLYITPDVIIPEILKTAGYEDVKWLNWGVIVTFIMNYASCHLHLLCLAEALNELLNGSNANPRFDIPTDKLTVILAGKYALPQALESNIYHCQEGRSFYNAKYMAFYCDKQISHVFKIKRGPYADPNFENQSCYELELFKTLPKPIVNDKKDKNKNPTPYTMGSPRYVSLDTLLNAKRTTEL